MILILIFLPLKLRAELSFYTPPPQITDCISQWSNKTCDQLPTSLKLNVDQCKIELQTRDCQSLAKKDPEHADKIKTCSPVEICKDAYFKEVTAVASCFEGFFQDYIEMLKDLYKKRTKELETCSKDIKCKREIASQHPKLSQLSDEQLKKYSASYLQMKVSEQENFDYMGRVHGRVSSIAPEIVANQAEFWNTLGKEEFETVNLIDQIIQSMMGFNLKSIDPELYKEIFNQIYSELPEWKELKSNILEILNTKDAQLGCYSAEAKVHMICFGLSFVFLPASAKNILTHPPDFSGLPQKIAHKFKSSYNRILARRKLNEQYLKRIFATEEENLNWMRLAAIQKGKTHFLDVENAILKYLNDTIKDKNLVTSLTNLHKEKVFAAIDDLAKKYPDLKVHKYSDFKSSRFAFEGDLPDGFTDELAKVLENANKDFLSNDLVKQSVRKSDLKDGWFTAGFGDTADNASLAGRESRSQLSESPHLSLQDLSDPKTRKMFEDRLKFATQIIENRRQQIQQAFGHTQIMFKSSIDPKIYLVNPEALDLVRKFSDSSKLKSALEAKFHLQNLSPNDIDSLQEYVKQVDRFSPGIHVAKREIVSLNGAEFGGLSADFAGMGSHNLASTAEALLMTQGRSVDEVLAAVREGEKAVTKVFNEKKERFETIVKSVREDIDVKCTGDDCMAIPSSKPLSRTERAKIMKLLSESDGASSYRLSFVSPNPRDNLHRTMLATHGESIEKKIRTQLLSRFDSERLKKLMFGVEMNGRNSGSGSVQLLIEGPAANNLTKEELSDIERVVKQTIDGFNRELRSKREDGRYYLEGIGF